MSDLAKVMTLYVTLHAVKQGHLTLNMPVSISERAASRACGCFPGDSGSRTLHKGQFMSLEDALYAVASSSNDVTLAVAELVANKINHNQIGPAATIAESQLLEAEFVTLMNNHAAALSMTYTDFTDPDGNRVDDITSARDMTAVWNAALNLDMDFLEYMGYRERDVSVFQIPDIGPTVFTLRKDHNFYPYLDGFMFGQNSDMRSAVIAQSTRLGRSLVAASLQPKPSSFIPQHDAFTDVRNLLRQKFESVFDPQEEGSASLFAGAADSISMDCLGRNAVTATLTLGDFDFTHWAPPALGGGEFPAIGGTVTSEVVDVVDVAVAHTSSTEAVTAAAARDTPNSVVTRIYVSTWALEDPSFGTTEETEVVSLGVGSNPSITKVKSNLIAVAYRLVDGRLKIDLLSRSTVGGVTAFRPTGVSYTSPTGETFSELSVASGTLNACMHPSCVTKYGLLVAARRHSGGVLRTISFLVDDASITRGQASDGDQGTQIDALSQGLGYFATSSVPSIGGNLSVKYWRITTTGNLEAVDDNGSSWMSTAVSAPYAVTRPVRETSIARVGPSGLPYGSVGVLTATVTPSGLLLDVWERDVNKEASKSDYMVATGVLIEDNLSSVSVCRLSNSPGAGDFVVSMLDENSEPKLVSWRVGAP